MDDNFIGNKKQVKNSLLPAIKKWQEDHKYVYQLFTEASINLADDEELLIGMRDAGFNEVFVGIETPSIKALKETGKIQNLKNDMLKSIRKIQQYGMEVMAGFILGFDSDTEDIFDRQINFIQKTGIPKAMIGLLTALPGTDLYNRLEQEGRIKHRSLGNNTHCMTTNFATRMDSLQLQKGYAKVLGSIYDSNLKNYFKRCSKLLDNLGKNKYFQRKITFNEIIILLINSSQSSSPARAHIIMSPVWNFKTRKNFCHV